MLRNRLCVGGFALLATVILPRPSAAQSKASTPPRTPDGKPNLTGIYSFSTITPLQRPETLSGKATLTDEEAVAFEASENTRQNRDLFDPVKGSRVRDMRRKLKAACCPTTSSGTSAATS